MENDKPLEVINLSSDRANQIVRSIASLETATKRNRSLMLIQIALTLAVLLTALIGLF